MIKKTEKLSGKLLLPMTNDLVFRVVYGRDLLECKRALAAMLNLILDEKERPITELRYENPINLSENIDIKGTEMDIKISVRKYELIDTEMQVRVSDVYAKRAAFYAAQLLASTLERGEDYGLLERAVVVSLLCGTLFPQTKQIHTRFQYYEKKEQFPLGDISELHFVELSKIESRKPPAEMSPLEQFGAWLLLTGVKGAEERVAALSATGNEVIRLTQEVLEKVSEEKLLQEAARSRENWQRLQKTFENRARKEGLERGRREGRREGQQIGLEKGRREGQQIGLEKGQQIGLEKGRREVAAGMKREGISEDVVSRITGLPPETVAKL